MNSLIFSALAIAWILNLIYYPVVAIGELMWSFVSRTETTRYGRKWQDFKYDWFEKAYDTDDQIMRYLLADLLVGCVVMFFAAFLGSVGLLSWVVGVPLVVFGGMYGVRWYIDSNKS